jgi:hypothetical protein
MMTRKDYVATAQILSQYWHIGQGDFEDLISEFSDMFLADNPRFNPMTFEKACYQKFDELAGV